MLGQEYFLVARNVIGVLAKATLLQGSIHRFGIVTGVHRKPHARFRKDFVPVRSQTVPHHESLSVQHTHLQQPTAIAPLPGHGLPLNP